MRWQARVFSRRWLLLLVFLAAVPCLAAINAVETFRGHVDLEGKGHLVTLALTNPKGSGARLFEVEVSRKLSQRISFAADETEVLLWRGHLVVMAPREGQAFHFSIPGYNQNVGLPEGGVAPDTSTLDKLLDERFETTRIETAIAIISRAGPRAFQEPDQEDFVRLAFEKQFTQPPTTPIGNGNGSCGAGCSMTCGDGSSCSVTCAANRCASCSCPASCSCR